MSDLVATCPAHFFLEWIREGDPAGSSWSGEEWSWFTRSQLALTIKPGERLYIVARGKLRGYAPVVRVVENASACTHAIIRRGNAVACTLPYPVPGFQGLRKRFWEYSEEQPFPNWRNP